MKTFFQIVFFSVFLIAGYAWFSNSIPQLRAEPPSEEEVSLEGMTMETFVALGNKIFEGKGACPLCHNAIGHRAPLLDKASDDGPPIGARAADRLEDERYKGEATTAEEYLRESMVKPSAFVVAGFGKTGTNDTVSPMPVISSGPVNLSGVEIDAVIAYLQSVAGVDITVSLPAGEIEVAEEEAKEAGPVEDISQLVEKYECKLCHVFPGVDMDGDEPDIGPDLTRLARYKGKSPGGLSMSDYIRQSILDPNAFITEGFEPDTMPDDFAGRLRVSELKMTVEHLVNSAESGS